MFNLESLKQNELKQQKKKDTENEDDEEEVENEHENEKHDPQFDPVVKLAPIVTSTLEENEDTLLEIRCKLYRFDTSEKPHSYKERGVGILKILKHKETQKIRILMRREQTLKICANHYLNKDMKLLENSSNDKSFIWTALSDYADEKPKDETLACRFSTLDDANKFKSVFQSSIKSLEELVNKTKSSANEEDKKSVESEAVKSVEKEVKPQPDSPKVEISKLENLVKNVKVEEDETKKKA